MTVEIFKWNNLEIKFPFLLDDFCEQQSHQLLQ